MSCSLGFPRHSHVWLEREQIKPSAKRGCAPQPDAPPWRLSGHRWERSLGAWSRKV